MLVRRGIGRVGRPGLVGTMARTAVVAGTATAVAGGMSRRQQAKAQQAADADAYQQQQQQLAAQEAVAESQPAPAAPAADPLAQLERLAALKNQGILTDAEFEAQKAKILGS
jgi:Short C-terminal domain